jgi:hypothetical protein
MSDNNIAANGPGPIPAISMILYPLNGPAMIRGLSTSVNVVD